MSNNFNSITIQDNMFFQGINRWSPKGVCFQPVDGNDPLTNLTLIEKLLDKDTENGLTKLNINCIRVYQVGTTHSTERDEVMQILAEAGIAVLVGAVNSSTGIPRNATNLPQNTIDRVKDVADIYANYNNVLGFSISNELLDNPSNQEFQLPGLVKQLKKILASHLSSNNYRAIPIGCCTRDVPNYTFPATEAYVCGSADDRMDFIGYNCYRWVVDHGNTPSSGTIDSYYKLYQQFENFPVPVMLTEIGAQCLGGRGWTQIPYIFGSDTIKTVNMADAISGCFAFQYYQHANNFGLVEPNNSSTPNTVKVASGTQGPGGYDDLAKAYSLLTTFDGTANNVTKIDCSSLHGNPYAGNNDNGGLPSATEVKLTNVITNPQRKIAFSYSMVANPTLNEWKPAVTINIGGSSQSFTFPKSTMVIGMSYFVEDENKWYSGCQLKGANLLNIIPNATIQGQWEEPSGEGSCPLLL